MLDLGILVNKAKQHPEQYHMRPGAQISGTTVFAQDFGVRSQRSVVWMREYFIQNGVVKNQSEADSMILELTQSRPDCIGGDIGYGQLMVVRNPDNNYSITILQRH